MQIPLYTVQQVELLRLLMMDLSTVSTKTVERINEEA
jgi:hypothetical protein